MAEMRQLKKYDTANKLNFVNLHDDDFNDDYPHIDTTRAKQILHEQLDSGELLPGLDVTHRTWSMFGKHKWLVILYRSVIQLAANGIYLLFARYRNRIFYLVMEKPACSRCLLASSGNKSA